MKILIVDDSPRDRKLLRAILESRNCEVIEAGNGQEGLDLASAERPDLIISDAMMPVMDGFRFLRQIKSNKDLKSTPFVFYSSFYTSRKELELALKLGADTVVVKPASVAHLWEELGKVIEDCRIKSEKPASDVSIDEEEEYLREYAAIVSAKLEEKVIDLENEIARRVETEEHLRTSEEQYRRLFAGNPMPMWVYDLETLAFLAVNDAAVSQYGYSREEFLSMTIRAIRPPEDVAALLDNLSKVSEGLDIAGVWRHRKKDGSVILVEIVSHALVFSGKKAEIVMAHDVTEHKKADIKIARLNRIHSMLSKINETIVRVRDRNRLFHEACRIAVEIGYFRMAWIGLIDRDSMLISPVARCGHEEGYLDEIEISISEAVPGGRGPAGNAVRARQAFICNDIEHSTEMLPWRDKALKRGYRSLAAFPLMLGNLWVTGVVIFYSSEPFFFDDEEIGLLREVTEDISFALEFIEKEEQRRKAEGELKDRVEELEKFYEMAVGRELRMKELKEKIVKLEAEVSRLGGTSL